MARKPNQISGSNVVRKYRTHGGDCPELEPQHYAILSGEPHAIRFLPLICFYTLCIDASQTTQKSSKNSNKFRRLPASKTGFLSGIRCTSHCTPSCARTTKFYWCTVLLGSFGGMSSVRGDIHYMVTWGHTQTSLPPPGVSPPPSLFAAHVHMHVSDFSRWRLIQHLGAVSILSDTRDRSKFSTFPLPRGSTPPTLNCIIYSETCSARIPPALSSLEVVTMP